MAGILVYGSRSRVVCVCSCVCASRLCGIHIFLALGALSVPSITLRLCPDRFWRNVSENGFVLQKVFSGVDRSVLNHEARVGHKKRPMFVC